MEDQAEGLPEGPVGARLLEGPRRQAEPERFHFLADRNGSEVAVRIVLRMEEGAEEAATTGEREGNQVGLVVDRAEEVLRSHRILR